MASQISGCYTSVKDQEYVDFFIKGGMPKDEAKKLLGSHWTFKMDEPEYNKWVWWVQCDELPELSMLGSAREGVEQDIDHPLVGGKAKMLMTRTGPSTLKTTFESEAFGEAVSLETYAEEGYYLETIIKGESVKEFWPRYVNESGFFKYDRSENMEAYCKAQGMPDEMISAFKELTAHQKICGNKVWVKEAFGAMGTSVNTGTMDEECTYKWDADPQYNRKYVMTRVAPGKFKYIVKSPNGRVEEIETTISDDGMCYKMTDKMSGEVCKSWMKRYIPFEGKYKMVATDGFEEYGAARGFPKDVVEKLQSENPCTTISCKDGIWHVKLDSKVMPIDIEVPLNKEFDMVNPINNETSKLFCTVAGNTLKRVMKSDKCIDVELKTFGETFLLHSYEILGLGIKCKIIFERISEPDE